MEMKDLRSKLSVFDRQDSI